MTSAKLTISVENVFGRLCAYPQDTFMTDLLHLKDEYDKNGVLVKEAKCFGTGDIAWLQSIAEKLGAELAQLNSLKGKSLDQWVERTRKKG